MTRTGNRLTTADVSEWDGDDEMEHAIYNYNHNTNGAMTFDSMSGISGTHCCPLKVVDGVKS